MLEIKLLPGSEIEIIGEIPADDFESCREEAIKRISQEIKIDGFRPGKIPENILVEKAGEDKVLEKMTVVVLEKEYSKIIEKHKIEAIGRPLVTITKIARNNPLGFKIRTFVMPEIELPDYKKIAREITGDEKEKRRLEILEKIASLMKVDIPKILIEAEKGDLTRVKFSLILNEIAKREKIEVSEEEVNKEAEKIMEQHKDLDPERVKIYTYGIIRNEKVFKFLELCSFQQ